MGYNTSRATVQRHLPQLEQLKKAGEDGEDMFFPTQIPRRLAHKLREALSAASKHKEYVELHTFIWPNFQFKEVKGGVMALYIGSIEPVEDSIGETISSNNSPNRPLKKTLPDAVSLMDVVTQALTFPQETELYFPAATLEEGDKHKLKMWTEDKDWGFIDHSFGDDEGGLTLTKNDVEEEMLWTP